MVTGSLALISSIYRAVHAVDALLGSAFSQLTPAEAQVMAHLAVHGHRTVGQIHAELGYKRSTLTSILNRLEARDLITCQVNEADKRSLVIGLTAAGTKVSQSVLAELLELENEIVTAFSRRDQESTIWMLAAVKKVAERSLPST